MFQHIYNTFYSVLTYQKCVKQRLIIFVGILIGGLTELCFVLIWETDEVGWEGSCSGWLGRMVGGGVGRE